MHKKVVYTALFGSYDKLLDPLLVESDVDYLCFTDQRSLSSSIWHAVQVPAEANPTLAARKYKILAHEWLGSYSTSLYVDANIGIKGPVSHLFTKLSEREPFWAPSHPLRQCSYDELAACLKSEKITRATLEQVQALLRDQNFPSDQGLTESGILLRCHHNADVVRLMARWYEFVLNYCERDQVSLPYLAWKHGTRVSTLSASCRKPNPYFYYRPHRALSQGGGSLKRLTVGLSARRADNYLWYGVGKLMDLFAR